MKSGVLLAFSMLCLFMTARISLMKSVGIESSVMFIVDTAHYSFEKVK